MKLGFIGAGSVGTSLGLYFKERGVHITGYYSRTKASAQYAASLTGSYQYNDIASLLEECNMVWITTNDDAIEDVAKQIERISLLNKKSFVHASGLLTSALFESLSKQGHAICSAHPLMAFSAVELSVKMLANCSFFIEGNERGLEEMSQLFNKIGNKFVVIEEKDKIAYHAGAVIASNYLVTLIHKANQAFALADIDETDLQSALNVLLNSALENISQAKPQDALTGPIKRGDMQTVAKHLMVLESYEPELAKFYRYMALETMNMLGDYRLKGIIENE